MSDQLNAVCPSDEELASFVEGSLLKGEHERIAEHLGICSGCYLIFAELAREKVAIRKKRKLIYFGGIAVAAAVLLFIAAGRLLFESSLPSDVLPSYDTPAYWVQKYGQSEEHALGIRANRTFERLVHVVEHVSSGPVRLLLVGGGEPSAVALPNGHIVLTDSALKSCYRGVTPEQGDARLAFVLGHELAHVKKQQFLHAAAFSAIQRQTPADNSREKELEADAYGLIYATMAGYDPDIVLKPHPDFISEWVSQIPQTLAFKSEHPAPAERADFLRNHLQTVANDLQFFYFGVRLYYIGRYEDAIYLLSHFAEQFPAREVFNNLGLCHYQLAVRSLAACDPGMVLQAYPATIIDTQTLAGQFRSTATAECLQNKFFQDHIQQAQSYFRKAIQSDTGYSPARVNLASTQLTLQKFTEAKELLQVQVSDAATSNNRILALYYSNSIPIDAAILEFQRLLQSHSGYAPAVYNLAFLQKKKGLKSEANENWKRFLELEYTGFYADSSRSELNLRAPDTLATQENLSSPIPFEDISKSSELLKDFKKRSFNFEEIDGAFYDSDRMSFLVLDGMVEVVEALPSSNDSVALMHPPLRTIPTVAGFIRVYSNFAIEIQDDRSHRLIYFK